MQDNRQSPTGNCSSVRDLMRVLGGARRYEIVVLLSAAPKGVSPLADHLGLDISAVSHDLKILRDHGCVEMTKAGTRREYRLSKRLHVVRFCEEAWLETRSDDGARVMVQSSDILAGSDAAEEIIGTNGLARQ